MATATATKVDLYKEHAADYATSRKPVIIVIAPAKYLTIDGQGKPGGEAFQQAIGALYGMAYTTKMASKIAGQDYAVCKLEAQYEAGECGADFGGTSPEEWRWKLIIRTPEFVGAKHLRAAAESLAKRGKEGAFEAVKLETIREGKCVQMLHVGPYDKEPGTIEKMRVAADEAGFEFRGAHHEIYLSDPRRVALEKLKTILRIPIDKKAKK
jgi:hypothetical protein